jgi:hypothetical protein
MKRFFTYLMALVLASAALLSCVKDEERIFEDSASARITKYLGETQKLLVDAPNGWVMYYYPNGPGKERNSQEIGGFVYTLVFTDTEVTAWTEIFEGGSTSLYSMSTDDGPILNFDTFNYNLYYFATPAGSTDNIYGLKGGTYYKAHQGDIGFKILSYSADKIVLRGKRSGNYYMMYPLPASTSPEEFAAQSAHTAETFGVSTFEGKFAGKDAQFLVNLNNRQIELKLGSGEGEGFQADETHKTAFAYTPTGIKFYRPVTLGGVEFDELVWNYDNKTFAYGSDVLQGKLPDYWQPYDSFPGEYTLYYYKTATDYNNKIVSTFDITITENVRNKSYWISGMVHDHDVVGTYDLSTGTMSILAQVVGTSPGYYYQLSCNNTPAGKVSYDADKGMIGLWEIDSDPFTVNFKDNGLWSYECTGFIMYQFTNAGTRVGQMGTGEWSFYSGSGYLRYLTKIVKK